MKKIAFVLFHTGETRALLPAIMKMANKSDKYSICLIPVGQAAKANLPNTLKQVIKIPGFINKGQGSNDEFKKEFPEEDIQEVLGFCQDYDNIVIGFPATIQEQIAKALPSKKQRIIYFDTGNDQTKINTFIPLANILMFTNLSNQKTARELIDQRIDLNHKPEAVAVRHGDFDLWLNAYKSMTKEKMGVIRKNLHLDATDKIILWAGGYGNNFSSEDQEGVSFNAFIETFKLYRENYKLRITLHPGLKKTYTDEKLQGIIETYYLKPLLKAGFSSDELGKVIAKIDTSEVACVALGLFSANSTTSSQAVFIGARAKNIIPDRKDNLFEGIENVNNPKRLSLLLHRWMTKDRRHEGDDSYEKATKKLGIPLDSTQQGVKRRTV